MVQISGSRSLPPWEGGTASLPPPTPLLALPEPEKLSPSTATTAAPTPSVPGSLSADAWESVAFLMMVVRDNKLSVEQTSSATPFRLRLVAHNDAVVLANLGEIPPLRLNGTPIGHCEARTDSRGNLWADMGAFPLIQINKKDLEEGENHELSDGDTILLNGTLIKY